MLFFPAPPVPHPRRLALFKEGGDALPALGSGADAGDTLRGAVIDTDGDGFADEREVYENGLRVRLDTDTNGDHRPDVVQYLAGDDVTRQDEAHEFDGFLSVRYDGDNPVEFEGKIAMPAALPELQCGKFHGFWRSH